MCIEARVFQILFEMYIKNRIIDGHTSVDLLGAFIYCVHMQSKGGVILYEHIDSATTQMERLLIASSLIGYPILCIYK